MSDINIPIEASEDEREKGYFDFEKDNSETVQYTNTDFYFARDESLFSTNLFYNIMFQSYQSYWIASRSVSNFPTFNIRCVVWGNITSAKMTSRIRRHAKWTDSNSGEEKESWTYSTSDGTSRAYELCPVVTFDADTEFILESSGYLKPTKNK